LTDSAPQPSASVTAPPTVSVDPLLRGLDDSVPSTVPHAEAGMRFGLPQLFLLVLASAVAFASARAFGWQHLVCNGPLFLLVAALARGRRVEALGLQVLIFSAILWVLWLFKIIA